MQSKSFWIKLAIALFLGSGLVFFQNCGHFVRPPQTNSSFSSLRESQTGPDNNLIGRWQSTCMSTQVGSGKAYQIQTFEFRNGSTMTVTDTFFRDDKCNLKSSQIVYTGVFKVGNEAPDRPSIQTLDYSAKPQTITPLDLQQVQTYQRELKCGTPNWELGSAMPAELCPNLSTNKYFDILRIQNGRLNLGRIGEKQDGSSPEARPTEIESQYSYKRL